MPASSVTVERFMEQHLTTKAMSTLQPALAAITHYHSRYHFPSPSQSTAVQKAMEGAKRVHGSPCVPRKIMTLDILKICIANLSLPSSNFVKLRTVWRMTIEYFGLLRFNEIQNLCTTDITFDSTGMFIYIERSKTDQRGVGDHVRVLNHADSTICPVRLTRLYLDKLGYQQGVMLPSLRGKIPNPKVAITYKTALRDLKNTLISIGVDPTGFGEHSGRRGGTTAAAAAGAPHASLKSQGRWKSDSSVERYTDNAKAAKETFARYLSH